MSIKDKYSVKSIDSYLCKDWLLNKHYAKRIPSISYSFGLFDKNLIGICTFGSPPSRSLCVGVCGEKNAHKVYELNRLCVNDNLKKNVLSFFVSSCLNLLKKDLIIVSYADTSVCHNGYIYQATNWIYTGLSAKRTERYDINNPNKHSKSVTEKKGVDYKNLAIRERPQKHRYIYFTGSKKQKRKLKKQLNYKIQAYPKGENKRYDASYKPIIQTQLF
tara:strand:+ start:4891 stop:5544 length:654 start_codon:yes stop_codon:yes gene_type:complete